MTVGWYVHFSLPSLILHIIESVVVRLARHYIYKVNYI